MPRYPSRPQRWSNAISEARQAIEDAKSNIETAMENLRDVQSEYQDWLDNLPDFAQGSALNDKLDEVTNLDLDPGEPDFSEVESVLDEAEAVDLPRGFGRD